MSDMKTSKLQAWGRDFGMTAEGVARLIRVSKHTVISWRREDRDACEPHEWRQRVIAGLEAAIERLKKGS